MSCQHLIGWIPQNHLGLKVVICLLPRYGLFCFLAQLMASIFPSVPRTPNPPGTNTPLWKKQKVDILEIHEST